MENVKLNDELETQKLNLRDINEFLTNELKARSLTTSAMEAKVVELYHLLDDVNKSHEVRRAWWHGESHEQHAGHGGRDGGNSRGIRICPAWPWAHGILRQTASASRLFP